MSNFVQICAITSELWLPVETAKRWLRPAAICSWRVCWRLLWTRPCNSRCSSSSRRWCRQHRVPASVRRCRTYDGSILSDTNYGNAK